MPKLSMINQNSIHSLKGYFDGLPSLKKLVLPWGIRVALSKLVVKDEYSASDIEPLVHAIEKSRPFFRQKNRAVNAFCESPLIKAYLKRSSLRSTNPSEELAAIAQSNRPMDVAEAFNFLQQLDLLSPLNRHMVANHKNPEYLAKALKVLLTIQPLSEEKIELYFDTIIKSSIPLAVANALTGDSEGLFYFKPLPDGQRLTSNVMVANRSMLAKSQFPLPFTKALSTLQASVPHIFASDAAISAIQLLGEHRDPFNAALLIAYLFNEGLLTNEFATQNFAKVAAHSNPRALRDALEMSIDDVDKDQLRHPLDEAIDNEDEQRLRKLRGWIESIALLQSNFETLVTAPEPAMLGFSLAVKSKEKIITLLAKPSGINPSGLFFSQRGAEDSPAGGVALSNAKAPVDTTPLTTLSISSVTLTSSSTPTP